MPIDDRLEKLEESADSSSHSGEQRVFHGKITVHRSTRLAQPKRDSFNTPEEIPLSIYVIQTRRKEVITLVSCDQEALSPSTRTWF